LPGGIRSIWERDALGRPLRQEVWSGDRWKAAREYKWEPNDRLRSIVDATHGPTHYTHDTFGHLAKAFYDDGRIDLRMPDEVGNLFRTETRTDRQYGPSGQLLQSRDTRGTTHYEYDPEGNLVRKIAPDGVWTYAFDGVGNLVEVVRPDGLRVEFGYDAFGRRLFKKSRGKVTRFVWDGQILLHEWVEDEPGAAAARSKTPAQAALADEIRSEQLAATLARRSAQGPPAEHPPPLAGAADAAADTAHDVGSADHPITWLIHPESFAPLAKLVGNERYGIVTDHLGVPLSMFDDGGREVWHAEIDAYGDLRRIQGDRAACPFRWPGQYEDVETGLYYNRFRYYDPQTGEFCSQDPIRLSGGLALYAYPLDPLAWIDPLGLDVRSGEGRDHVTYRATKDGKPYTGYASAPSELGLQPNDIVARRYGDDFTELDNRAPTVVYHGEGTDGKATARGLEQHYYDVDVGPDGTGAVANRQRPVGPGNARRAEYEAAAEAHLNRCGAA
jgi:RHS repeat-associated protein